MSGSSSWQEVNFIKLQHRQPKEGNRYRKGGDICFVFIDGISAKNTHFHNFLSISSLNTLSVLLSSYPRMTRVHGILYDTLYWHVYYLGPFNRVTPLFYRNLACYFLYVNVFLCFGWKLSKWKIKCSQFAQVRLPFIKLFNCMPSFYIAVTNTNYFQVSPISHPSSLFALC